MKKKKMYNLIYRLRKSGGDKDRNATANDTVRLSGCGGRGEDAR
jgi:hypothetical protein